ncbi:glycosyltransferase family 4 protein [Massilia sp. IC2-477]|uniref:glycosyltransferase family 4 protein n=1 Tax=Massilia sp. IC2-477 TaxID=2887198 RepID=UPI001D10F7A6|nr:glycosyltransferase family 4 protein [Massilia sp. IC2-477]MCC2958539.1 glycosyltransferase family 4 protein [Massilia sp. IC2-477]
MNKKIVMSVNTAWNIYNFRSGLVKALSRHGYDVMVMAREDEYAARLAALGCRFKLLPMDNNGTSPVRDFALLVKYWRVLQSVRPLVYLGYTIKPNVYGSIAAAGLGIPVINNIAGLGTAFLNSPVLSCLARRLYQVSLRRSARVFFQNPDDRKLFVEAGLTRSAVADLLPGSGIDLQHFHPLPQAPGEGGPRFLLVARVLRDKGIEEYAAAAEAVRRVLPSSRFGLLGAVDPDNPNSIPLRRVQAWHDAGLIQYLGKTDDVRPYMANADCIVLPSYREGVPHSLLEAAAMARPIIATDVAGCREVVEHGRNGLLCKVRSAADLAQQMIAMANLAPARRAEMGMLGRHKVASQFDERIVIGKYLNAIMQIEAAGKNLQDRNESRLLAPETTP